MDRFFDTDFLYIVGLILLISLSDINPYMVFFGSLIAIIAGLFKIVSLYYNIQKTREELKEIKSKNKGEIESQP